MKNNKKCKKVLYDAVPGAGTIQLKIICFMTKPDVISTIDDFYFCECHLIIAKFYEKSEYVKFLTCSLSYFQRMYSSLILCLEVFYG